MTGNEDIDYGFYSKSRLDAEADYKYYRISGETDSFTDVKVWLFLTQLNRDMVIRYLYCMFGTYQLTIIAIYFYSALECGMDIKTLSEILGHKNSTITLNRYCHALMEHKSEMMKKLGRMFG